MQGTWIHPYAAIHLAQWLSPQFAVAVAKWTHEWMSGRMMPSLDEIDRNLRSFNRYEKQFGWQIARSVMLPRMPFIPPEPVQRTPSTPRAIVTASAARKDSISAFRAACLVDSAGSRVRAGTVVAAYMAWCAAQKIEPLTATMLGRELGRVIRKSKYSGHNVYHDVAIAVSR